MLFDLIFTLFNTLFISLKIAPNSGSFPKPLSKEQEREALERMAAGDAKARDLLIEHNLRLVAHVVKKYYSARDDAEDLISVGSVGLIKAIESFDTGKNIKLATYAAKCIENEILMYFRSLKKQAYDVYLSDPIDSDKEGNALSLLDVISCEDTMLDEIAADDQSRYLYKLIDSVLDERERELLIMRYGLFNTKPLTQREVAGKCKISRSYVSRIEKKAIEKLRVMIDRSFA